MYFSQISRPQGPLSTDPLAGVGRCGRLFILHMACVLYCACLFTSLCRYVDGSKNACTLFTADICGKTVISAVFFAAGHTGKDLQVSPSIVEYLLQNC